jgi:hypothetical protein
MSLGIKSLLSNFIHIILEKPQMSAYCRTKTEPFEYYRALPSIEDADFPEVIWELRKMGSLEVRYITANEYSKKYTACSPFEAISSITK